MKDDYKDLMNIFRKIEIINAESKRLEWILRRTYPKRILKSGNATIVFWMDGEKTVVKRAEDESDNIYSAFTAALAIRLYGSNSKLKKVIENSTEYQQVKKKQNKPDEYTCKGFEGRGEQTEN